MYRRLVKANRSGLAILPIKEWFRFLTEYDAILNSSGTWHAVSREIDLCQDIQTRKLSFPPEQ